MAGNSGLSADVVSATSLTTAPVPAAMPRNLSFTKTMARKVSSSARSVLRSSLLHKAASPALSCAVPIAAMHLFQRKTAGTLSSINALTRNVPITFITSRMLTRLTSMRTTAKTNTNSTTSTVSSRWIFSAWT